MKPNPSAINAKRLKRLFRQLLAIYSPSGKEEQIVDFLYGYLRRKGLPAELQKVEAQRFNLIVPPAGKPRLALIGHVDTVTAQELEDIEPVEEGNLIYGLGAADMKGGCAAMIEVIQHLWETGQPPRSVLLALVVGEEDYGDGAEALIKDYEFPWAVIGEPTGLSPCLSHYGYIEIMLRTSGQRLHASLSRPGINAVEKMLGLLMRLTGFFEPHQPELTYNIRDLFSSSKGFAVPDSCEAWIDVHVSPATPLEKIIRALEAIIREERTADRELETEMLFNYIQGGFELPAGGTVLSALRESFDHLALPWTPAAFPSHSDANQLWSAGVKPIVLGPGSLDMAHHPKESIHFSQVQSAAELYLDFVRSIEGLPGH